MAERYAAFISYSHRDQRIAAWLQRVLEGYRVPAYIVGRPGAFGEVPARIGAVFRDREDLPASADLAASVKAALFASDALIVLCSPDAARSRWVDAEIAQFKARAGEERVFALIVAGEPFADEAAGHAGEECMPLALRRHVTPDGVITERIAEPVAADLRHDRDGKRLARSKIIAGLLGIPLDMLIRREHARRQRGWAALAAASMLATVAMGGLALEAVRARDEARARRADAEQLVEFMLGDLRKRLDAVGRLDVLDAVGAQTMRYYGRQRLGSLNADELARRARALQLIGELSEQRGDLRPASAAFQQAAETTGELLARAPGNGQRVFDHAQSIFFVGDVAQRRGELESAAAAFAQYVELANRLVGIDPRNDVWRAELAYSRGDRGAIELKTRQIARAIRDYRAAAEIMRELAHRHPEQIDYAITFADDNGWLSDADRFVGDLTAAERARSAEAQVYRLALARDPNDARMLQPLAWSQHAQGVIAMDRGNLPDAVRLFTQSANTLERLHRFEPRNVETMERLVPVLYDLADARSNGGDRDGANNALQQARGLASVLPSGSYSRPLWRKLKARIDLVRAECAERDGNFAMARWIVGPSSNDGDRWIALGEDKDDTAWRARAWLLRARLDNDANEYRTVVASIESFQPNINLDERCYLAQALRRTGSSDEATKLISAIAALGYRRAPCSPV